MAIIGMLCLSQYMIVHPKAIPGQSIVWLVAGHDRKCQGQRVRNTKD